MSAEHQLTPGKAGILGKHPGFGDFIAAGLSDGALRDLGDWMQVTLGQWRNAAGEGWQARLDACPRLGFWIGPAVLAEGTALRGVWQPSRDRAGRRFPLLVLQAGGAPPISDPGQDFYRAAASALDALMPAEGFEPRDVAARLATSLPPPQGAAQADWPVFWALNPRRGAADLLSELAAADHAHAMAARSYWWFHMSDDQGAGVLACHGLPGAQELDWLISGGASETDGRDQG